MNFLKDIKSIVNKKINMNDKEKLNKSTEYLDNLEKSTIDQIVKQKYYEKVPINLIGMFNSIRYTFTN
jgi:hypothetical protein